MKAIIVYYSQDGNTEVIAKDIARKINAGTYRLKSKNELDNEGVSHRRGFRAFSSKLANQDLKLDEYDTVIIGTPVWAYKKSSAVKAFLTQNDFCGKSVYLFACHSGDGAENCLAGMKSKFKKSTIKGAEDFVVPILNSKEQTKKISSFCELIMSDISQAAEIK